MLGYEMLATLDPRRRHFFSCCNSHVFDARSPHRQEELELGWELLLAVEAIAEVDAADA